MTSPSLADIHTTMQETRICQELGTNCAETRQKQEKKFPNNVMNRETKAAGKIGLIETNFISVRVTSSFFVTRDPNFYRARVLKSIPDPFLVLFREFQALLGQKQKWPLRPHNHQTRITPSPGHKTLPLTSLTTQLPQQNRKELILSRCSPSIDSSQLPK